MICIGDENKTMRPSKNPSSSSNKPSPTYFQNTNTITLIFKQIDFPLSFRFTRFYFFHGNLL